MARLRRDITADVAGNIEAIKVYMGVESLADLARILGVSPQRISSWGIRGTYDTKLIIKAIPEIREEWLISGEGDMLRAEGMANLLDELKEMRELLKSKDNVILQQAMHIGELTELLNKRR